MNFSSIDFRLHAIQRMFERNISVADVKDVLKNGIIIEEYLEDSPYPSYLLLGYINGKPIHVVVLLDSEAKRVIIITVYEPNLKLWKSGFKKRTY